VVALQEVTANTKTILADGLRSGGLEHVAFSMDAVDTVPGSGPRSLGVLIASRAPIFKLPALPVPWPEKTLSVALPTAAGGCEIHAVHVPPGSTNSWVKVEVLEGIARGLALSANRVRVLCGDFNAPQLETPSGALVTWAQRVTGGTPTVRRRFRGGSGARWDLAERTVLAGALIDAFRSLHGYDVTEASWYLARNGRVVGRRFDHVFVSPGVRPTLCEYRHEWRTDGLSDHSAIEVELELGAAALPTQAGGDTSRIRAK